MKKALITGSRGFVGHALITELEQNGYAVCGADLKGDDITAVCDVLDAGQVAQLLAAYQPDVIYHLAGQASVAKSWLIPQKTFELNVISAMNIIQAMKQNCKNATLLLVGSSDMCRGQNGELQSPYAVSKKAQEDIAGVYVRAEGLDIRMTHSYNHSGAGQAKGFIIPDFCSQIAVLEKQGGGVMQVGNLQSKRDFSHVKDVVAAYRIITENGEAGQVYNVGSGTTYCGQELIDMLMEMTTANIDVKQASSLLRQTDQSVYACDNHKIRGLGWKPKYSIYDVLHDCLDYYRDIERGGKQ